MRDEKEIKLMYENLKKAQGNWVKIDSRTKIKLSENNDMVKLLKWVLNEKEEIFELDDLLWIR